ncbi:MAG TPA: cytochrome c [Gaiellaceae bacterium]|jgi:cytochrome c551/c552|nr:cytochrome c [Gaiellaceae bacterium]
MLFALSTSHEIGLALTGAIFIIFALASSFLFPRFDPNFPGKKGLRWYIPLCFVFFIAMMSAVLYFGREEKSPAEAAVNPPAGTTTTGAVTSSGKYAGGNAAAGKPLFTAQGCSVCHTLAAAGSTGTLGPNLDNIADYAAKANEAVDDFVGEAIVHPPPKYVPPGYANTMPTDFGTKLSTQQVKDLVAFVTSK